MMPDSWKAVWAAARDGDLQRHSDTIHRCKTPLDTAPCLRSGQVEIQIPLRILVCQVPNAGQVWAPLACSTQRVVSRMHVRCLSIE